MRSTTWRQLPGNRPQSDRHRADDVRAGQQRALSPQDLSRGFHRRRRDRCRIRCFDMIRNTHRESPDGVLSAYQDNAAVFEGRIASRFFPDPKRSESTPGTSNRCTFSSRWKRTTIRRPSRLTRAPPRAPAARSATKAPRDAVRSQRRAWLAFPYRICDPRIRAALGRIRSASPIGSCPPCDIMLDGPLGARLSTTNSDARQSVVSFAPSSKPWPRRHGGSRLPQADHAGGWSRQRPTGARSEGHDRAGHDKWSCWAARPC